MQQAGAGNSIGDNLALKATPLQNAQEELEAVKAAIAEAEYAMLRFEDDFAKNASANGVWNRNGNHDLYLINLSQEERDRLMLYAENNPEAGTNIAPRGRTRALHGQ